jgi:hypothetical protein
MLQAKQWHGLIIGGGVKRMVDVVELLEDIVNDVKVRFPTPIRTCA